MDSFEVYVFDKIAQVIQQWRKDAIEDVYALSFYFWFEDDDLRHPCVTVGYNTIKRWKACTPAPGQVARWPIASDSNEAKWNYAFWLHNEEIVIGPSYGEWVDSEGITLRQQWIGSLGLWYTDEDKEQDFEKSLGMGSEIAEAFTQLLARVAKRLHDEGYIEGAFGKPIPILVHDLEYTGSETLTRDANPRGLASEFVYWVLNPS